MKFLETQPAEIIKCVIIIIIKNLRMCLKKILKEMKTSYYKNEYIILDVRTVLYKSLAISLSLMDSALHSENFTSPAKRAGAPLVPDSAETATQNTNNNDESIVTKYLVESVTVYPFFCSA